MYSNLRFTLTNKLFDNKYLLTLLILTTVFSTPLFENYSKLNFEQRIISVPKIEYVKNQNSWGVQVKRQESFSDEKHFCWINKQCTPPIEGDIIESELNGYRMFKLKK